MKGWTARGEGRESARDVFVNVERQLVKVESVLSAFKDMVQGRRIE